MEILNFEDYLDEFDYDSIESVYTFDGHKIPRVNHILDVVSNPDLLDWKLRVGKYKADAISKIALSIGSAVHESIEKYILDKNNFNDDFIESKCIEHNVPVNSIVKVYTCIKNFIRWENDLRSKGYTLTPIANELKLICPYFGGTADFICSINGANYVIDFKTSKSINELYLTQTAAYRWSINNGYSSLGNIHIHGIGIIRIDKNSYKYEDLFLSDFIPGQAQLLDFYTGYFWNLLNTYYTNRLAKDKCIIYKEEYDNENYGGIREFKNE